MLQGRSRVPKLRPSRAKINKFLKNIKKKKEENSLGNSLVVQWLGLGSLTAVAQVQFLVGELRSRKPRGKAKKRKLYYFPFYGQKAEIGFHKTIWAACFVSILEKRPSQIFSPRP